MNIKYKKPRYLLVLIPFGLLMLAGIISLIAYDNRSITFTNISISFGFLGTVWGLIMLTYRMIYIYEAEFDNKGIDLIKRKDKIFINFSNISDMEYEKPTMFNYLTSFGTKLFPGILNVNVKESDVKVRVYFIRLKYKDFELLPKKYKDLIKYPT